MMSVSPRDIRQAVAMTLQAVAGWRESRWPFELIGYDPDQYVHRSFAVGVPSTTQVKEHQRQRAEAVVSTIISIRFLWRIRSDNMRADYDSALDGEQELIQALLASPPAETHVVFRGATRDMNGEAGYYLGTITFECYHVLALQ